MLTRWRQKEPHYNLLVVVDSPLMFPCQPCAQIPGPLGAVIPVGTRLPSKDVKQPSICLISSLKP